MTWIGKLWTLGGEFVHGLETREYHVSKQKLKLYLFVDVEVGFKGRLASSLANVNCKMTPSNRILKIYIVENPISRIQKPTKKVKYGYEAMARWEWDWIV